VLFQLYTIGRPKTSYVRAGIADYQKRLTRYCKFCLGEISPKPLPPHPQKSQIDKILESEAQDLQKKLTPGQPLIVLDIQGKGITSEQFAQKITNWQNQAKKEIQFVIGGPFGLPEDFVQRAQERWSLSKMTLPHELCVLIFLEQLYRAHTIIRNEPYHK
jgi:23S rRNA (pseudouridine1915-N3)-methyltransferase